MWAWGGDASHRPTPHAPRPTPHYATMGMPGHGATGVGVGAVFCALHAGFVSCTAPVVASGLSIRRCELALLMSSMRSSYLATLSTSAALGAPVPA